MVEDHQAPDGIGIKCCGEVRLERLYIMFTWKDWGGEGVKIAELIGPRIPQTTGHIAEGSRTCAPYEASLELDHLLT